MASRDRNFSLWRRTLASMAMGLFVTPPPHPARPGWMAVFGLCGVVTYLLFRPRQPGY
jgi:hypothetical protein